MKKGWDIVFSLFIQLWITRESNGQDRFCQERYKDKSVNICTNHSSSMRRLVFIDTVNVPKFQQSFCECIIEPFKPGSTLQVIMVEPGKGVQFKINNIVFVFDKTSEYEQTILQDETTLYFSTAKNHTTDACAAVYVIVVPVVVGVLLILAAAVLILVYVRRRRIAKNTKRQKQEPCMSLSEQGQGQQNNPESEEGNLNIAVNAYERLNMYVNDQLAGEMYQQLNANKTGEYQEMYDVVTDSRNQNRNVTKQVNLQDTEKGPTPSKERLRRQAKGQGISNGEIRDIEFPSNAYERLNIYVNDNLAGEMYEQLDTKQGGNYQGKHVPGKDDRPVNKSDHRTKTNEQAFAVYANAK
ncbi:uncharacterized protein LOC123552540 isoform X7 [Mercenaria mercenaria]|uniref:uncharacterized protein LOC123552540 isoform X7 n=1 Tax=Mercenaria mercenaria TaxID=6596 RepID=UPI00234E37C2|nr:uncharacterized protein LOC123552540 isoform X7 [Mercenaria mercenaria]